MEEFHVVRKTPQVFLSYELDANESLHLKNALER